MSEPFIFIGTYPVREGRLEDAKQALAELAAKVEANEPRLQHFGFYFDDHSGEVSCLQVHPDAESMEHHMKVIEGVMVDLSDYFDWSRMRTHAYGVPGDALLKVLRDWDGDKLGVASPLSGFSRLAE